jgi:DNA-binding MarR family transcriptional regulator
VRTKQTRGDQTFFEELSEDLRTVSAALARYAAEEKARRHAAARERVTASQVRAVLAARYARSERLGLDLANPGWSLLLELFRAELEKRPARLARIAADARVPGTTALRWVEALAGAGLVRRDPHPEHEGVYFLALTDAGSEAMEDYFILLLLGWAEADAPEWSG